MPTYAVKRATAPAARLLTGGLVSALLLAPVALRAQVPAPAGATSSPSSGAVADLVANADRESVARHPGAALGLYERALQLDARAMAALAGAAREAVDLGEFERDARVRTTLYAHATDYARRAVAVEPANADAHFHLARALGRTALALGARERVRYAVEVRDEALKALALAPRHPGALHVLGVWHAEVMRLNGFERAFAKAFLGGQVFGSASWREAVRYIEAAVAAEPNRLVHRLDLGRIYRDAGRLADARAAYEAALGCAIHDANDPRYRELAGTELRALSERGRA
jgi:tetratricopeptide (TPR) repeat protein